MSARLTRALFLLVQKLTCEVTVTEFILRRYFGKFNPFLEVNVVIFKMFVAVLNRSLIRNLLTTPGVYGKFDVRTTKRTLHGSSCDRKMPSLAERSLGNKQDDQLSHCTLTNNGHKVKLTELSHCTLIDNGHKHKLNELSHCTLIDNCYKHKLHVNEPSHFTQWPVS